MTRSILIVEDDEGFRYAAARYLQSKGHRVMAVSGSMAALKALDSERFDVVVADVVLNDNEPHGVALARMITSKFPRTKIIFATVRNDLEQIEVDLPGKVLSKPVELEDLARAIDELD